MADGIAGTPIRQSRTICRSITEEDYEKTVDDCAAFRRWVTLSFKESPELFPKGFTPKFSLKDRRPSEKQKITIRRIQLPDGNAWSVRPSFVMPGMTARTKDVEQALFLRKFAVPYWALAHVFGRNPMFWYRAECRLGRFSVVGTTVKKTEIPRDLLADEHHQKIKGEKCFIATTVGGGCILGAEVAETAGCEDLTAAYGVFGQEAVEVQPDYVPTTVNTDGWKATRRAWTNLFPLVIVLSCFLHAWLNSGPRTSIIPPAIEPAICLTA